MRELTAGGGNDGRRAGALSRLCSCGAAKEPPTRGSMKCTTPRLSPASRNPRGLTSMPKHCCGARSQALGFVGQRHNSAGRNKIIDAWEEVAADLTRDSFPCVFAGVDVPGMCRQPNNAAPSH